VNLLNSGCRLDSDGPLMSTSAKVEEGEPPSKKPRHSTNAFLRSWAWKREHLCVLGEAAMLVDMCSPPPSKSALFS
jgi:hypothetical protein